MYSDMAGSMTGLNHKTGATVNIKFVEKVSDKENSCITGYVSDA